MATKNKIPNAYKYLLPYLAKIAFEEKMGLDVITEMANQVTLSTSDHASVSSICLFSALLCGCIVIGHLLEENRWVNESITALLIVSDLDR